MSFIAPNLSCIVGPTVAAKLMGMDELLQTVLLMYYKSGNEKLVNDFQICTKICCIIICAIDNCYYEK